jgi:hypothetical protein
LIPNVLFRRLPTSSLKEYTMDLNKLSLADKILFGSGIVFMISTFLGWFTFAGFSGSGWDVGFLWGRLPFFIVLAMLIWVGLKQFSSTTLPAEIPPLYLVGGGLVALLPLLKLIIGEDGKGLVNFSRGFGLFLAVLSGIGFGYGALQKFLAGGGDLDQVKAQLKAKAEGLGDQIKDATKKD